MEMKRGNPSKICMWSVGRGCAILRVMTNEAVDSKRIADWLRERNLNEIAAFFIEATKPLNSLGAQAAYLVAPLVGGQNGPLHDLACILEDPDQVSNFVGHLKRGSTSDG